MRTQHNVEFVCFYSKDSIIFVCLFLIFEYFWGVTIKVPLYFQSECIAFNEFSRIQDE